ncbi:ribosome maturation factor RimP [Domibacillus sp. DTU_2020_1001157_1_SI_ALB_TIR_016]|uniref:ribosome maturation factor RimP n=1 Tax=Domibacillus sp. DTU_2020_1001157_1_SI_ALB_TIR_016 TaxID=3077789 RepID=UPI0028E80F30|nr:ribosome maturation factor RimP [Domibacillus sp. DTU_2020_1001157_1_SI_ALB_TIR_016]WNS79691.1 ribosome maturation factor RimP [Domibacillus sp. DTU_2020_1001157_1_SI_ALB_TIR_016]
MSKIIETVEQIAVPIIEELNLELVETEYVKEGKNWFLRLYIDKENGVDIEECAAVSERLSEKLDALDPDPIPDNYFLEVSSPGAERPLKKEQDFERAVGRHVNIKLYEPIDGEKTFEGTLLSFADGELTVEYMVKTRKKQVTVPLSKVAKARLAVTF